MRVKRHPVLKIGDPFVEKEATVLGSQATVASLARHGNAK